MKKEARQGATLPGLNYPVNPGGAAADLPYSAGLPSGMEIQHHV
jgi:hypothetical protein